MGRDGRHCGGLRNDRRSGQAHTEQQNRCQRAGLASGGDCQIQWLVIGFARLGAILYARVGASIPTALPEHSAAVREGSTNSLRARAGQCLPRRLPPS
jgi:hypothetical protein